MSPAICEATEGESAGSALSTARRRFTEVVIKAPKTSNVMSRILDALNSGQTDTAASEGTNDDDNVKRKDRRIII